MTDPAQPAPVSRDTREPDSADDLARQRAFLARKCHLCGFRFDDGLHDPEETLLHDHKFVPEPVAEASEDTKPARCTCDALEVGGERCPVHGTRLVRGVIVRDEPAPAPASDDEKTPGPSREQARDYLAKAWWSGAEISFAEWEGVVDLFEAAIRAPLAVELETAWEQLRQRDGQYDDMNRQMFAQRYRALAAEEQVAAVTAERDEHDAEVIRRLVCLTCSRVDGTHAEGCGAEQMRALHRMRLAKAASATEEVQG